MLEVATPALCESGPTKSAIERHAKIIQCACEEHAAAVQKEFDDEVAQFIKGVVDRATFVANLRSIANLLEKLPRNLPP